MMCLTKFITISVIMLFSMSCAAKEDSKNSEAAQLIESNLTEMLPAESKLLSVEETDMDGFFEVNIEGVEPLYASADGNYLVSGDIYLITKDGLVNKSEARRDYQRKTLINNIDQDDFITFKPDLADYKVYVFTDVDCGYCRQFHNQIDEYLNLGIQVNYLAYPRAGLDSESYEKISSAWCDEDPQYSLTLLKQGKEIDKKLCSNSPVEKHFKLGQAIGVQGTPSIVTEDGRMIPGYLPPQELLNILDTKS